MVYMLVVQSLCHPTLACYSQTAVHVSHGCVVLQKAPIIAKQLNTAHTYGVGHLVPARGQLWGCDMSGYLVDSCQEYAFSS